MLFPRQLILYKAAQNAIKKKKRGIPYLTATSTDELDGTPRRPWEPTSGPWNKNGAENEKIEKKNPFYQFIATDQETNTNSLPMLIFVSEINLDITYWEP